MIYVGIDPGKHGGIAILNDVGRALEAVAMPATERDILDVLEHLGAPEEARAVLERVWSSPQMGVASAFTFGRGYGALRMALTAARVPFDEVTPAKWQGAMGVLQPGATYGKKDKNVSKRRAQQLFPTLTITHAIADSLLIAEYCRRTFVNLKLQTVRQNDGQEAQRAYTPQGGVGRQTEGSEVVHSRREEAVSAGGRAGARARAVASGDAARRGAARHGRHEDQAAR
jgi:hypothetical protein